MYRTIDRERNLVDARLSLTRDRDAAQRFFARAVDVVGHAPEQVTTDGHDAYPRAIREALGDEVTHRMNRYKNNRIAQDHCGIKRRYYAMGSFIAASRFCSAFEDLRQYFRTVSRCGERVSLAERRCRFQARWAAVIAELAAA